MMLIATLMPSERANSSASKFLSERRRACGKRFSPSSSIASMPMNMYSRPSSLPEAEHLLVAQQHVAAGLEVVLLADAAPGDRLADRHAVLAPA